MKKIYIKAKYLFALMLLLSACNEDFIDIPAKGTLSTDAFVPDLAVTGCYAAFYRNDVDEGMWNAWATELIGNVASDDAWKGGSNTADAASLGDMELFQTQANNGELTNFWTNFYKYIYYFNTTIEGINNTEEISDEIKNRYLGEVKFLRGYAYMRLILAFGSKAADLGVVVINQTLSEDQIGEVPRSNYQQSWDQVISDLKFAEENLPEKSEYDIADLGRATKGAAEALLARSYMYLGDWANCELYSKKVIDSQEYQLESDFGDVFLKANENGMESIFEIAYSLDAIGGYSYSHAGWWAVAYQPRGPWGGWGLGGPTADLLNEFKQEPGDPRIIWTFLFQNDVDISQSPTVLDFTTWLCPDKMHNRKFWDPLSLISPDGKPDINLRVIRYADVLLMYAEAANENGKTTESLSALNMVRKRARESRVDDPYRELVGYTLPDLPVADRVPDLSGMSKEDLRDAIWHERRLELAGEGYRFFDLVRQGRAGEVLRAFGAKYNTNKGANFQDGVHEAFPIPSIDISAAGGTLIQNPGYN